MQHHAKYMYLHESFSYPWSEEMMYYITTSLLHTICIINVQSDKEQALYKMQRFKSQYWPPALFVHNSIHGQRQ